MLVAYIIVQKLLYSMAMRQFSFIKVKLKDLLKKDLMCVTWQICPLQNSDHLCFLE